MKSRFALFAILALALVFGSVAGAKRADAQLITPYFVAMLAGPVSDGSSVILVKKRPNFIGPETPLVACTSGIGAGFLAAALPSLFTYAGTGIWNPINWGEATLLGIYGCVVSGVGGIGGALTELAMVSMKGGH
jgi:hypothetical protein